MTNFENTIKKAGETSEYTLSDTERAKMSRVVHEYMAMKPLPRTTTAVSYHYWFALAHRPIAAALVLVLVFGSSVSYAAESALPGDALYAVKTYINEPAKVALATSAEAKAEVQIELAERRIEEAATLAAEGRLDETTEDKLASAFESHAAALAASVIEADTEDESASIELTSRFESRIAAHGDVLLEVESESAVPHSSRLAEAIRSATLDAMALDVEAALASQAASESAPIEATTLSEGSASESDVATMAIAVSSSDSAAESAPEPMAMMMDAPSEETTRSKAMHVASAPAPAQEIDAKKLARMKSAAEKSLKNARKKFDSAKALSETARTKLETDLGHAASLMTEGTAYLAADADADAYAAFKESLRISEQTVVFIKAAPVLQKVRARTSNKVKNTDTQPNASTRAETKETETRGATNATTTAESASDTSDDSDERKDEDAEDSNDTPGRNSGSSSTNAGTEIKIDLDLSL